MITPLYKEYQTIPNKPNNAHTGLWFDRFFNQYEENWGLIKANKDGKVIWINKIKGHTGNTKQLEIFTERQIALVAQLKGSSQRYKSDWHFITGMGNSHPVENGFSWHQTLAVPYLSGASVKGLVRAWVELNDEELSEEDKKSRLKSWFGTEDKKDIADQTGDFIFFDALPNKQSELTCDIMTPHMGDWYSKGDEVVHNAKNIPADWHEPVPVPFLVVKETAFIFHIAPRSGVNTDDLDLVVSALTCALEWLGAGAKTSAGYGYMTEDSRYKLDLKDKQAKLQIEQEKEQALNAKLANLSSLAQDYFRQAEAGQWTTNKNSFLQAGLIEGWLTTLEETVDTSILEDIVSLLDQYIAGLLNDPDKVKGKKSKPVYNDRQRNIAKRVQALQTS
ncbi:CRISPR-associated protein Cmr6 [Bathymodiolus japonicus methanotrophic gill symbiont]|uniref:type III-B CRISPR module RAMP protein Cmr6 n=1 Tax=Bathymodiolus japonicus methanotrophic gill symbiont TaxID=113269 RepID=UPI001B538E20|nr:type III-B CRISPR module RAMP protein Cmr6 [Bathymodiolus japonicus methanotrophic gill symbiont]GFO73302.1 CRISPR-associated protein Cmr6 [Bathymodiolus japonicus methanotrophic gill symbiont]